MKKQKYIISEYIKQFDLNKKDYKKVYNRIYKIFKQNKIKSVKKQKEYFEKLIDFSKNKKTYERQKQIKNKINNKLKLKKSISFYMKEIGTDYTEKDYKALGIKFERYIEFVFQNDKDREIIKNHLSKLTKKEKGALLRLLADRAGCDIKTYLYSENVGASPYNEIKNAIKLLKDINNVSPDETVENLIKDMEKRIGDDYGETIL